MEYLEEERDKILEWLYEGAFDTKHREISNRRQKNTAQWILVSPEVTDWMNNPSDSRLLWGYGIPGAGKTFLSSMMIDYFQEYSSETGCGLAYIYFNYKEQLEQKPAVVLASIIKQLSSQLLNLPKVVQDLYGKLSLLKRRPSFPDLENILVAISKLFPQTYIICDALDECPQGQRRELLPFFLRIGLQKINIFLTSRDYPEDIQCFFESSAKVRLSARDDDITSYIEQKIEENSRAKRLVNEGKCKDLIISRIKRCANKMFLLVHFQIEHLCQQTTVKEIIEELEAFESSSSQLYPMDPTYDRAMEIVQQQAPNCKRLAFKIFSWLYGGIRPLKVRELQHAVSIEEGCTIFDDTNIPDRKTLLDVCASLVTINEEDDTIRFVHRTVAEYLLRTKALSTDLGAQLAIACATYLSLDVFSRGFATSSFSYNFRHISYPFLRYAARCLSLHLDSCDLLSTIQVLLTLVDSPGSLSSYLQASRWRYKPGLLFLETPLHVAIAWNHFSLLQVLLDNISHNTNINARDSKSRTPLHYASYGQREDAVRLLLDRGADTDLSAKDIYGWTALHIAANNGNNSIVDMLLSRGASVASISNDGFTALHCNCVKNGSEMSALINNGAEILAIDNDGNTLLHWAVIGGVSRERLRLVMGCGVDINFRDKNGWTALHRAVYNCDYAVVYELIQGGVDISVADNEGLTAFHYSVMLGYDEISTLLEDSGASLSVQGEKGGRFLGRKGSDQGGSDQNEDVYLLRLSSLPLLSNL
ncbi:ankyrin repeat-containing domain protein [Morchella snyderi]|nr:ankyrin repeat-containing domain protein [Morchella snyderi]